LIDIAPALAVRRADQRTQVPLEFCTSKAIRFAPSGIETEIELWPFNTEWEASRQVGPGLANAGQALKRTKKTANIWSDFLGFKKSRLADIGGKLIAWIFIQFLDGGKWAFCLEFL
jgi:hypothetical protein